MVISEETYYAPVIIILESPRQLRVPPDHSVGNDIIDQCAIVTLPYIQPCSRVVDDGIVCTQDSCDEDNDKILNLPVDSPIKESLMKLRLRR